MSWIFCWLPFDSCSARRSASPRTRKRVSQAAPAPRRDVARHPYSAGEEQQLLEDRIRG